MPYTYVDPDIRTPAGSYRHPRHYAVVTPGPPPPAPALTDGRRLRQWRLGSQLTQRQVATVVGVSIGQVSRWERGVDSAPAWVLAVLGVAGRGMR